MRFHWIVGKWWSKLSFFAAPEQVVLLTQLRWERRSFGRPSSLTVTMVRRRLLLLRCWRFRQKGGKGRRDNIHSLCSGWSAVKSWLLNHVPNPAVGFESVGDRAYAGLWGRLLVVLRDCVPQLRETAFLLILFLWCVFKILLSNFYESC